MAQINPYIHFNGNSQKAFTFYKSVFGGEFAMISHFRDISMPKLVISEEKPIKLWENITRMKPEAKFQ